jgi:hypothetical protein
VGPAAAIVLAAASASAQQLTVSAGLDPGTVVRTELEHLRFRTALPFDVQFYVRAPITDDVEEVQGKVARKRGSQTCEALIQAIPTMPPSTSYRESGIRIVPARPRLGEAAVTAATTPAPPPPVRATFPPPGSPPGWLGYATMFVDNELKPDPKRVFELSVPALKPRKDYCFGFVLRMKTDQAEARALVVQALDTLLRKVPDVRALGPETEYQRFRAAVLRAIDDFRVVKERTKPFPLIIEVPADSWFNVNRPVLELSSTERLNFLDTVQAQVRAATHRDNYRRHRDQAVGAITTLQNDPGFTKLLVALRGSSSDIIAAHLSRLGSAMAIGDQRAEILAAGEGGTPAGPRVDPADVWAALQLDARIAQLDATMRDLSSFVDFVTTLSGNPGLRAAAGLDPTTPPAEPNANAMDSAALLKVAELAGAVRTQLDLTRRDLGNLERNLAERSAALAAQAEQVAAALERDVTFSGTTLTEWKTRATAYISADVGLAYSGDIDQFFIYLGTNFYVGPVNKKAPLSFREDGFRSSIRKRFALMFGIPINGFDDTTTTNLVSAAGTQLDGVIGSRPLLVGAGFRINEFERFTGGSVFFKVADPNLLVNDPATRHSAFFSISVDWDIRGMFGGLTGQTPTTPALATR